MIAKEGAENELDLEEKLVEQKCPIGREMKISSEKGFRFLKTRVFREINFSTKN